MPKLKFTPVEFPSETLGQSLIKAAALTRVLQCYVTSATANEAPVLEHVLYWYCEALNDQIRVAQQESERLESARLQQTREAANG